MFVCVLVHLREMRTVAGDREDTALDGNTPFNLFLEDNVRAFVGAHHDDAEVREREATDRARWSCKYENRVWDVVMASDAAPPVCHLRYFG